MSNIKRQNIVKILILIFIITIIIIGAKKLQPQSKADESSNLTTVSITYKTNNNETVTITENIVDKEINNGRAWIEDISTIQSKNNNFISLDKTEFIGWKYEGSMINETLVTQTSAYTMGNHFTQDEYYSLSKNETEIILSAVWGYKVYVDGTNGIDDADGLTAESAVRTMGRAYEILAQLDSNNSEANITGFKVEGDSETGYIYQETDENNRITDFNGKIVIINNINYEDKYEGRYTYITYGDLINSSNYDSSTGIVIFNDGVSDKTITNVHKITGYSESDPVKLKYSSKDKYTAQNKTASGSLHFLLKKSLNNYSYEVNGITYYTYGRLTQYTESLRAHVGKGIMTPENDGLVLITSGDGESDYKSNAIFDFSNYTRYASGGAIIYKNINLHFYHNKSEDGESEGYVGGYAANGNYLAFDENVTIKTTTNYYKPNVYGGTHSYRVNSANYSGSNGNQLGNSGSKNITNSRITIKSGDYTTGYSGSYGATVGESISTKGTEENNAAVINIYGGTYSQGVGMGHEGASSYNSYVYVYNGTFGEIHGSGIGSSGAMTGGGETNVLISGNIKATTVYGGSGTGTHTGNINLVIKDGTVSSTLYGGSKTKDINGDININIMGGTINSVIGGCATGNVNGNVSINMSGGTINGTIYTSGQGNTATETTTYYNGDENATGFSTQILDENDSRLNLLITGNEDVEVFEYSRQQFNSSATQYHNDYQYDISGTSYYYPHIYKSDYSSVIVGIYRSTYTNHGPKQYTVQRITAKLSLATVQNTELNISGGTVNGNIFGGGKVSVVKGNVNINIGDATINGNVYGGGDGSYEPTVTVYKITGPNQNDKTTQTFTWKGSETFDLSNYDFNKNVPIDYQNKYIYSPTYDYMGGVEGNVNISINNGANITGNVHGGGNAGNVFGTTTIDIDNAIINQNIYGGGYSGIVEQDTTITIDGAETNDLFGGGYSGPVNGSTYVTVNKGTYSNVFGGGDQSYIKGNTTLKIGDSNNLGVAITGLAYGGGRGYDADSDGDASDFTTVYGSSKVDIQGTNTNVENYGSIKLGAVLGEVNLIFDNYWTGNATSKYKTMNGIDRATNVTFNNSYVLLENKDSDGNLEGIKAIENLSIKEGSGLKISADGEITGNFEGGGELYLDSEVCLTVGGNISGVTKLVLNPMLFSDTNTNLIKGGIDNPYLKVVGESLATDTESAAIEIISGEKRYDILARKKEDNGVTYSYYYIAKDINITDFVQIVSYSIADKIYNSTIENNEKVNINGNQDFTTNINLHYELLADSANPNKYTAINRELVLKIDADTTATIPKGTEILMIDNGNYYFYILEEDMTKIPLAKFKDYENKEFVDIANIRNADGVTTETNETTQSITYRYDEEYRFIIDFAKTETSIKEGTYYPMLNINDNNVWLDEEQIESANNIQINNVVYDYTYDLDKETYEGNGIINLNGTLKINGFYNTSQTDLSVVMKLIDENGNKVDIPDGSRLFNGEEYSEIQNGTAQIKVIENLMNSSITQDMNLSLDMSKILLENKLADGNYKIVLELRLSENEVLKNIIQNKIDIPVIIRNDMKETDEYGVKAQIVGTAENIQLIKQKDSETRTINLQYIGTLEDPKVKIKKLEKTAPFEYTNTENANNIIVNVEEKNVTELVNLSESQELILSFGNDLNTGTYRIVFELYDKYENKLTETLVNFIVIE